MLPWSKTTYQVNAELYILFLFLNQEREPQQTSVEVVYETQPSKKVQFTFSVWRLQVLPVWDLLRLSSTVQRHLILFQSGSESGCLVERSSPGNVCCLWRMSHAEQM